MASPMKQWRKDHDVTQAALAADMGQSASTLSQKENGHLGWQQRRTCCFFMTTTDFPLISFLASITCPLARRQSLDGWTQ